MNQEVPVQAVLACSQCGKAFAQSDLVQISQHWVCADCKPAFLSWVLASGAGAPSPLGLQYAGVWIRFAARFVDGLVLMVPVLIFMAVLIPSIIRAGNQEPSPALGFFSIGFLLVFLLATACYEILMLKHRGATLGKMACGLKVVRSDGRSLSWGVCVGRFFMWNVLTSGIPYLSFILMIASSIMAGVDEQKRAMHDRVCDTRVIYSRS